MDISKITTALAAAALLSGCATTPHVTPYCDLASDAPEVGDCSPPRPAERVEQPATQARTARARSSRSDEVARDLAKVLAELRERKRKLLLLEEEILNRRDSSQERFDKAMADWRNGKGPGQPSPTCRE